MSVCVSLQLTGVMMQGRSDGREWVTSFMMSYSVHDVNHWTYVHDQYDNQRVSYVTLNVLIHSGGINARRVHRARVSNFIKLTFRVQVRVIGNSPKV